MTTSGQRRPGGAEPHPSEAGRRWAEQLAGWAIPDAILEQAPEPPWSFPAAVFRAAARRPDPDSASLLVEREALARGGEVLDVGCGGGAAGLALVPPATHVTGVDSSAELIAVFDADAAEAGIPHAAVVGTWPDVAGEAPAADVVVCHHVVYNVPTIEPFVAALARHARRRVVVELTARHPLCATAPLWRRFWAIERPAGPTAEDFRGVLAGMGIAVRTERRRRPFVRDRTDPAHVAMV
ncbi:MAG: methyltransferase domain-containing protein, partial [Acidimicrobiales bacterium]